MYIELDFYTQQPESVVMEGTKRKRSDNEGSTTAKKSRPSSTPILEVHNSIMNAYVHQFDIATMSSLTFAWVSINCLDLFFSVLESDHDCIAVMSFCRCRIRVMS